MTNKNGFSIIELLVVVAIFGILSVIATPSILSWRSGIEFRDASQQILQVMKQGRELAISTNRQHRVEFDLANDNNYVFQISAGDRASNSANWAPISRFIWLDNTLGTRVTLRGTIGCNSNVDIILTFNPNGTANQNSICVMDAQNIAAGRRGRIRVVNSNTGRIIID